MIKGRQFIFNFLKYSGRNYQKEDYNFSSGKCLKKIFQQKQKCQTLQKLLKKMRVGWFSEPVIYLKQTELNQSQILSWLQQVTNHQIFEFANKINDKEEPEENLLWFNSQSFHSLQAWLVNQFQKSIIKNFFSKKNNYSHLQNFKTYVQLISPQELIFFALTLDQLKLKTKDELEEIQNSMKIHELNYLEELNTKIITSLEVLDSQKTKKRKNKKKLKKKSSSSSPFVHNQVQSPKKKHPDSDSQMVEYQQKSDAKQAYEQFQQQQKYQKETQQISTIIVQVIQEKRDFEEDQEDNKSSISHDRISPSKRNSKCRDRSLSPNAAKSTPNQDCSGSLVSGKCYQTFTEDNKSKNQQFQLENFDEMKQDTNVAQKKRRRKKNKNQTNVVEDMANKATIGLINKQLTSLIDNLGIQTNSLYQSKVLAFQRVVFFIKNICPQAEGLLFGSNAVGLSLPTSDIDIVLHNVPSYSREFVNEFLAQVAIDINAMGWIVSCSTYLNAKIPLVKLQIDPSINYFQTKRRSDYQTLMHPMIHCNLNLNPQSLNGKKIKNIQVDLSISMEQGCITGVQSTQLMRIWMEIYPQLQRILIAFKYVLAQKGFNSNFKGGIGGYCLFVMISAYFKQFQKQLPQNEGELFLNILKFYGQDFQNKLKSITLRQTQSCFISLQQSLKYCDIQEQVISMNPLRIIDPLNQKLTSSSCHQYPIIKAEFRRIRKQLLQQYGQIQKELTVNYNPNDIAKIMATKKGVDKWINKYQSRSGFCIGKIINGTSIHQYQ